MSLASIHNFVNMTPIKKYTDKLSYPCEFSAISTFSTKSNTPEISVCDEEEFRSNSNSKQNIEDAKINQNAFNYSNGYDNIPFMGISNKPKAQTQRHQDRRPQQNDNSQKMSDDYQTKYKTEMCKNFELTGTCKFGTKCCFAHGRQELRSKQHQKPQSKTKPCKQFFVKGYCPYGNRCQYLHSDIKQKPEFYDYLKNIYLQNGMPLNLLEPCRAGYNSRKWERSLIACHTRVHNYIKEFPMISVENAMNRLADTNKGQKRLAFLEEVCASNKDAKRNKRSN